MQSFVFEMNLQILVIAVFAVSLERKSFHRFVAIKIYGTIQTLPLAIICQLAIDTGGICVVLKLNYHFHLFVSLDSVAHGIHTQGILALG